MSVEDQIRGLRLECERLHQHETLRDRFAMAALGAVTLNLQGTGHAGEILAVVARDCYDMADAMMLARKESK